MNIVFVLFRAYPPYIGGNEIEAITTARELVKKGYNIKIFSTDLSKNLEPEIEFEKGITIHRFPSYRPGNKIWFSPALFKALLEIDDSVVHAISLHVPAFEAALASRFNKRFKFISEPIYDFIEPDNSISNKYKAIEFMLGREILHSARKIRCLSEGEKRIIIKRTNILSSKCEVIPVHLHEQGLELARKLKKENNESGRPKIVLYVGRLVPHKSVSFLIEAFANLLTNSNLKNVELHIVGDGTEKFFLQKLVFELGIGNNVKFLGFLPDNQLYQEYSDADLFVLPSRHEVFSIATIEALSLNIPAIVLDMEPFKELISERQLLGIKFPINIKELGRLMWQCLTGDIVLNKYTPLSNEVITEKLVNFYSDL
jgi:glycosyltransferase involved in cell wall biosynthesis